MFAKSLGYMQNKKKSWQTFKLLFSLKFSTRRIISTKITATTFSIMAYVKDNIHRLQVTHHIDFLI